MKQKHDEMLDEWVRQRLTQLPDAPPPGSSFDSARLWSQLRPELPAKPTRPWVGWWLAAACLAGLVIGWLVWPSHDKPNVVVASQRQANALPGEPEKVKPIMGVNKNALALAEVHQPKTQRTVPKRPFAYRPTLADVAPPVQSAESELPVLNATPPVATSVVANAPDVRLANVATTNPKRRFRVMHENELRAEDETAPKPYRADSFVRLGGGERSEPATDSRRSGLTMPLTNQSNQ